MRGRVAGALMCTALVAAAQSVHANGAFPDSAGVLLPADRPHEILLATNFGLIHSADDGASWSWICEQAIARYATLYQVGPPPGDLLVAVSPEGVARSDDDGCSWQLAGGTAAGSRGLDAFIDASDGAHVLALAQSTGDGGPSPPALLESSDGARSFGPPRAVAPTGALLSGVEIARSAPRTIYLAGFFSPADPRATAPFLLRSTDGAGSFVELDQLAALGPRALRIAAVDPADPARLFLRVVGIGNTTDALALSTDGGATATVALELGGAMTAFLRRSDGTLLVGADGGRLYRSSDGGATFSVSTGLHLRGLAERDGLLYAAADNLADGAALFRSADGGAGWEPLLRYQQLAGPRACGDLPAICAGPWAQLRAGLGQGGAPDLSPAITPARSGCGCTVGARPAPRMPLAFFVPLLACLLWLLRRCLPTQTGYSGGQRPTSRSR